MDENQYALNHELRMLNNDRRMTERAVDSEKNRWAEMLRGEVGNDMNDILSGKKKIESPKKKGFIHKLKKILRWN